MAVSATAIASAVSTVLGLVVVGIILRNESPEVRRHLTLVAIAGGACAVVSVAFGTWVVVERVLARRLRELTAAMRAAEQGRYVARERDPREDELGVLSRAFDHMLGQITDLSVAMIDTDRELAMTRRELKLKEALELLFELTQSLSSDVEGNAEVIVRAIPGRIAPTLGVDEMAILLADDAGQTLTVHATHGFPEGEDPNGLAFDVHEGVVGVAAATRATVYIADTSKDGRYLHYKGRHAVDGSVVCVPMIVKGKLLGVFNAQRGRVDGFSNADVRLLESLASATGLAIAHARMTTRLRDLATTDELTGVPNRRQLMERLAREVDRALRGDRPLAALMLDLDHFKAVNDGLGHQRGDEVLRAIAQEVAHGVRRMDAVGRYGGEEFVVLLPDTPVEEGLQILARLQRSLTGGLFMHEQKQVFVTFSAGVTAYRPGERIEEALERADQGLYEAKRTGKNRTCLG